jgi:hypothetical protein
MMLRVRAAWHEELQGFYITGSTSAVGTVSTFVASALATIADDFLNEKEILLTSGDNANLRRDIADWVSSTFTGTLLEQFPYAIGSGVTFEIGEHGFWSDQEIIAWLNDAAQEAVRLLANETLWDYLKTATTAGNPVASQAYGRADMPSDCVKPPSAAWVNGKTAKILNPDQKTRFDRDPFIGAAILLEGKPEGGNVQVLYKPYEAATITWQYAKSPAAFDTDDQTTLPARVHPMLVDWAIKRGWEKFERLDLAEQALKNFTAKINAANAEAVGKLGGMS